MSVRILHGDCAEVLKTLPDNSVDSIVTDPPYGLTQARPGGRSDATRGAVMGGFMGMKWDSDVPSVEVWAECLRVLKPGGYLLAFAGTRTQHRMAVRIEDAGFEIRDVIAWVYGSGFPKSLDVSKAIDKAAGAEREVVSVIRRAPAGSVDETQSQGRNYRMGGEQDVTAPATDSARQWQGWGTALKPALEPITVARKPLIGTVAENVLQHGTGALNIDGCRVPGEKPDTTRGASSKATSMVGTLGAQGRIVDDGTGRWPANLIHDGSDEVVALFPRDAGASAPVRGTEASAARVGRVTGERDRVQGAFHGDTGSAARFFASFPLEALCSPSSAGTAPAYSSLRNELAASVQSGAAIWPRLAGIVSSDWTAPSTSVTANESRALCAAAITAMATIGSGFSPESQHEKLTPCGSRVSVAASRAPTGTMTITANLWRSDGFAEAATFSITPTPLDLGGEDCARFRYCAKADRADRNEGLSDPGPQFKMGRLPHHGEKVNAARKGNHHPTVKPTDLMRYLCRLVTPPGGTVLDPFMGSGSTLKAAELEGFSAIGIEIDADYIAIARRRIAADAPLFAEVQA